MASRIKIIQGDITRLHVDAIVNATNRALSGGGGVDGAIHRAAGPELLNACRQLGSCDTGQSKITPGFHLPANHVIHTVGPVWYGGDRGEADLLASCYQTALALAQHYQIKTIAFPAISTGAYGYPLNQAAPIALREIRQHLEKNKQLEAVYLVCFDMKTHNAYLRAMSNESNL